MLIRQTILKAGAAVLVTGLLAGCQGTHQARGVDPSGFLKNYQQLKEGKDDQALLVYINPKVKFAQYKSIGSSGFCVGHHEHKTRGNVAVPGQFLPANPHGVSAR